jgi:hypothetical protein
MAGRGQTPHIAEGKEKSMQVETDDKLTGYKLVFHFAEEGDPDALAVSIEENLQHAAERIPARIRKAVHDGRNIHRGGRPPYFWSFIAVDNSHLRRGTD